MLEAIAEFFLGILFEFLAYSAPRFIGACTKWLFYRGEKSFSEIRKESWNGRLGLLIIIITFGSLIYIYN